MAVSASFLHLPQLPVSLRVTPDSSDAAGPGVASPSPCRITLPFSYSIPPTLASLCCLVCPDLSSLGAFAHAVVLPSLPCSVTCAHSSDL